MPEDQIPLFSTVVSIATAKGNKSGQQKLVEPEERYIPYSSFAALTEEMNKIHSRDQRALGALGGKVDRLTNTLDRMLPCLEAAVSGEKAHFYVAPHNQKADLATISSPLPAEAVYTCTTSDLAQLIGMQASRLGTLLRKFDILGDPDFHIETKTGLKSRCQKYKLSALEELFQRASETIGIVKPCEMDKLKNYLQISGV